MTVQNILLQVANRDYGEAVMEMIKSLGSSARGTGLINTLANYNQYLKDFNEGIITPEQMTASKARVFSAIEFFLDKLKPDQLEIIFHTLSGISSTPVKAGKETILYVSASPVDLEGLSFGREANYISGEIEAKNLENSYNFKAIFSAKFNDIVIALGEHHPCIVHFSGHGNEDGLAFEDDKGLAVKIDTKLLFDLFSEYRNIKCIFLNACYSAGQAKHISDLGIYVIGMQELVEDPKGISFSNAFYGAFFREKEIEKAFRIAVLSFKGDNGQDNVLPELYFNGRQMAAESPNQ